MAKMKYITRDNSDPKGKPKVYFTCHPADFNQCFEKLWKDISATHDVVLYYTADMTEAFGDDHLETDLGQMNLFVVPVTGRLLSEPNRAMDTDIAYAKQENIPILPFMMDEELDDLYSQPDKFGNRQYLMPCSMDTTAIRYREKLKKYLESVLISNEMTKRIQAAFDAYIFLSYRKKDRKYANKLMKLIHDDPECWDIAIWYDEFLTPGESFLAGIQKALEKSQLFALVVTPNLLEEPDGKPNFVMGEEYPAAVQANKTIIAAELVPTDRDALMEKYKNLPDCIDPHDGMALKPLVLQAIQKVAIADNDHDPEHNYLIGLAYLDGIDVEANRQRGIELITAAADANLMEAMQKLYVMYREGDGVKPDYHKALKLAKRIYRDMVRQYGRRHPQTIDAICVLAENYKNTSRTEGHRERGIELYNEAYDLVCQVYGEKDRRLIDILLQLADFHDYGLVNTEPLKHYERAYALQCEVLGEEDPDTVDTLQKIARFYTYENFFANHAKAVVLWEKVYNLQCMIYGADATITRRSEKELRDLRRQMSEKQQQISACDQQYRSACEALGETHPKTLEALSELACAYENAADHETALKLHTQVYTLQCNALGEEHQDTVSAKRKLAHAWLSQGNCEKALQLFEEILVQQCRVLGENHPIIAEHLQDVCMVHVKNGEPIKIAEVLEAFFFGPGKQHSHTNEAVLAQAQMLPGIYTMLSRNEEAVYWGERVRELFAHAQGEASEKSVQEMENTAYRHIANGDYDKGLAVLEKVYALYLEQNGVGHANTNRTINMLTGMYAETGQHQRAIALLEEAYSAYCDKFGAEDLRAVDALYSLAYSYADAGEYQKAGELFLKVWMAQCQKLGHHHEETQRTLSKLEDCLENLEGEPEYAALHEAYAARKASIPDEDDIDARMDEVMQAAAAGDYQKAGTLMETIYDYISSQDGDENFEALEVLEIILGYYQKANNQKKVAEISQRIYDLRRRLQGE